MQIVIRRSKNTGRRPSPEFRVTSNLMFLELLGEGNRETAYVFTRWTPLAKARGRRSTQIGFLMFLDFHRF